MNQTAMDTPFGAAKLSLPVAPRTIEETGLSQNFLLDLLLKILYARGQALGLDLAEAACLPVHLISELMAELKAQKCCEILGSTSSHAAHFRYELTERGRLRAREVMERDRYQGPAPVPLADYCEMVRHQSMISREVTVDMVRQAFDGVVMGEDLLRRLGAACNSGSSLFLYGYPGNGKTLIAERLSRISRTPIAIPHAIEADGEVIKFYDASLHRVLPEEEGGLSEVNAKRFDLRWMIIERPFVMVGGELRLEDLDVHLRPEQQATRCPAADGGERRDLPYRRLRQAAGLCRRDSEPMDGALGAAYRLLHPRVGETDFRSV